MASVEVAKRHHAEFVEEEAAVRNLLRRYVRAVDTKNLQEWTELFASKCSYVVISRENEERELPLAFLLDDSKERVADRVVYINDVWQGHYNDYQPRHIVSEPVLEWLDGRVTVTTSFALYISEPSQIGSRLLTTAEYVDVVVFEDGEAKFESKKVVLDTDVMPRYFVYPL